MDGTTEQLSMTAAELSFLLASGDNRHRPAVATFNTSTAQAVARGANPSRATLASATDGTWRFVGSDGTDAAATVVESFDEAAALMRDELAKMPPVFQAS